MRATPLVLVLVLCCASYVLCSAAWKRTNSNSTAVTRPSCPRVGQLERGVNSVRRDQAILCGFNAADTNGDNLINATEYHTFVRSKGSIAETLAPSWEDMCSDCDCNGDGAVSPSEAKHAIYSCLVTNLKIDLVYSNTCT
jgi:hypothetical protein